MKETLNNKPLNFRKDARNSSYAGINELTSWTNGTYERVIGIADFNESSSWQSNSAISTVIHEIGHNWDSAEELGRALGSSRMWNRFLAISSWTQSPVVNGFYLTYPDTRSSDGTWWYANGAQFARSYSQTNPHEDFSSTFETYFDRYTDKDLNSYRAVYSKINFVSDLMRWIS